ncbi:DEAD/DEAH box helicase [Dyadobacter sp. CY356]|uniref:DEAD/DEAH box helicase n=1 Tax=Dyadobacter sp. CY356 TaxID=2906442 RepID=UPI001F318EE0|nr:DEAD/DEAH box helicase family protein [Dyadobacter sp. CY356]MCF0055350.1 DEAD/DEAH box helicase family protein [Dyadobacter sp. CY356]
MTPPVPLKFPRIEKILYDLNGNQIIHYYDREFSIDDAEIVSTDPFVIRASDIDYLVVGSREHNIDLNYEHILVAKRKPTRRDFVDGNLNLAHWLKHPSFQTITPENVVESWADKFKFVSEDRERDTIGLRPPQLGAIYSILAHLNNSDDIGIVVMPTGTGKTETMLCTLIANKCKKLLVTVPSDSLRSQITEKFLMLGLLREFQVISESSFNPIVGTLNSRIQQIDEMQNFISATNVIITTMDVLTGLNSDVKNILRDNVTHLFVDEAHHSKAETWENFINGFDKRKVFLFTATPYRNDGKKLSGKFIFNFSLKKAQEQQYYKKINYIPIREYNKQQADAQIAEKAVQQLREDLARGHNHIILARCINKERANQVFEYYRQYVDLNPVLIYTNIPGMTNLIKAIKRKEHSIVVCVDMLGEGFDLPELKIAAIHDERQSLPITLQFIGRFTRTSFGSLGEASFITNVAYPPIKEELDQLYSRDSDWNLLLPILSEGATQKEIDFKLFLEGFGHLDDSKIPFQNINPALSTVIFNNEGEEWSPNNWREGISHIGTYEHQYSDHNPQENTLVIVLGKVNRVEWGDFDTVQNLEWDIVILFWDYRPNINRVFINTSIKGLATEKLMEAIFKNGYSKITGMDVFRIFHEVHRLSLFNVGARKGIGQDISFQSFFGKGVQDGIKMLEQGTLIKNNIFGVGFKEGEKVSLGCSVKGKIWSYLRGNLDEFTEWCRKIGDVVTNPAIDPNTVLQHTLEIETISQRPLETVISVDWHPEMYAFSENRFEFYLDGVASYLWDIDLEVVDTPPQSALKFAICTDHCRVEFEMQLGELEIDGKNQPTYSIEKTTNLSAVIHHGAKEEDLQTFFQRFTPIFWFANGAQLLQNQYIKPREQASRIPLDSIISKVWNGVSINKESQGVLPYIQDSIQYHLLNQINDDFDLIYDDDGKGEIADIIGINDTPLAIEVHLFHLKYARGGVVSNNIENFFQVCGQTQKAINWKYKPGKEFFEHLFRRLTKSENGVTCSRLIKGTEDHLEILLNAAKWTKAMKFHMYIVQPGLAKANASEAILILLGNTFHYLHTVGNIDLKVYSS